MKTIREHWESLPNKKLGEWLMKHGIPIQYKDFEYETVWDALVDAPPNGTKFDNELQECLDLKSWQPILDALPELREVEVSDLVNESEEFAQPTAYIGGTTLIQPQPTIGPTRRAEVVQLVCAIVSSDNTLRMEHNTYVVTYAITLQSEIDKQLKS